MGDPFEKYRGTGRTTRMLRRALVDVLQDQTVFVIGWRESDTDHMFRLFLTLSGVKELKPTIYLSRREIDFAKGRMIFRPASYGNFDWVTRRIVGVSPESPVHIDHYAKEQYSEQERRRAINAQRTAQLAEARKGPTARNRRGEDPETA